MRFQSVTSSTRPRLVAAILSALALVATTVIAVATPAYAVPPACSGSTFTVTRVSSPTLYVDLDESPKIDSAYEG